MLDVWKKYSEVYHYTTADGLQGILGSQTLFATHYEHLNDRLELRLLCAALPRLIEPTIKQYLFERGRKSTADKRQIRSFGGIQNASRDIAAQFAAIHFDAAFTGTEGEPAITAPYITSFCGLPSDDPYEREHGLLSQWRAYGRGGFAIIFDTERLWQLCLKEREAYAYAFLMFDDVIYEGDHDAFLQEFGPAIDAIKADVDEYLRGKATRIPDNKKNAINIVTSFVRLKHRGFKEEREVRIVACPLTAESHALMATEYDEVRNMPVKSLRQSRGGEPEKPQIELFDFEDARQLPIKRIIVGPQEDQGTAVAMAKRLVAGTSIQVTASETPLVQWPLCS